MTELKVLFFGALKQYFPNELTLRFDGEVTPSALKKHLEARLADSPPSARALLSECAVATESELLRDDAPALPSGSKVAFLPPVCGG